MVEKNRKKSVTIDFFYLDLNVCTRCQGTDKSLDEAIEAVSGVLKEAGIDVMVNKINVTNEELAGKYKFVSSPTIRVNGHDIQMKVNESICESCGDLCGSDVECRVWVYEGKEYTEPPKAMIIEGILKEIYGGNNIDEVEQEYVVPENLKNFYTMMKLKNNISSLKSDTSCCSNNESRSNKSCCSYENSCCC